MYERVAHKQGRQQGKDDDEGIEHGDVARVLEVVLAIEAQVQREANHEDGDVEYLSDERYLVLRLVLVAAVVLLDVRVDDAVGAVCHDFAAIHNLLPLLHQSAGQGNADQQLVLAGLAAFAVIGEVGDDVVVEVALLQGCPQGDEFLVHEQLLVGPLGRVDFEYGHAGGLLVVDDAYHAGRVAAQRLVLLGLHDALLVEAVQTVRDDADVVVGYVGNAVGVVGRELMNHLPFRLHIIFIIGFVLLHDAVALMLDNFFGLVDGKVEGGCQFCILPGLSLLYMEEVGILVRHEPDDDGDSDDDQKGTYQKVVPQDVFSEIEVTHGRIILLSPCENTKKSAYSQKKCVLLHKLLKKDH